MKIRHIVCLAIGAFVMFLAIKATVQSDGGLKLIDEAVYLESPVVLPENEGKKIIISGKVKLTKAAYDNELDIVLYTPVAERVYESRRKNSEGEYEWSTKERKTFFGGAALGEFELDESMLKYLLKLDGYWDFDKEDLEPYLTDSYYDKFYIMESSSYRYSYSHCDLASRGEMTLAGMQKGNSIVMVEPTVAVSDGILTRERLRQEEKVSGIMGLVLGYAIALGLIAFGVSGAVPKKHREEQNG